MMIDVIRPGVCLFDAFSIEECDAMLSLLQDFPLWRKAKVRSHGGIVHYSKNRQQEVIGETEASDELARYGRLFSDKCTAVLTTLEEQFGPAPFHRDFFQYQRTVLGGRFMWHTDRMYATLGIGYLSDERSHKLIGGATAFDLNGEQFEVKPVRGKAVLFNGDIRHKGAIVRGGVKISIVSTFYGPHKPRPPSIASPASGGGSSDGASAVP